MFDADRPITKSDEDRLNRSLFAKYLARCILDHQDTDSLVVGLYGGFGVGKTSIINLVVEELNFAASNIEDDQKPIILNFSAWSYSGQNEMIYSFFRRLSSALRSVSYLENSDRIIHLLELYVSFFTRKPVPKALRTKRSLWQKLTFQGHEEVYAWESGRDLTLVKAELNELLRNQKHRIIIIIDNISRLYPKEIKQIFQIVKSMGDYSNTTYLLSMDKNQVITAVNQLDGTGGEHLLEKVVQLPFDIPPILKHDLENIFADRLGNILKTVPEGAWDPVYWADLYYTAIRYFFENCRDISRYVNTLHFSYSRLRDIVNPADFFALTAIEVFAPQVYFGIRDNKDLFTDLLDHVYVLDNNQIEKDKKRCDEVLHRSKHVPHEVLLELLIRLFPRLRRIYQPNLSFYHSEAIARKLRRICSPDLFDAYFRLSMQVGQVPKAEFETLLSLAGDPIAFDHALTRLNQDDRITKFLDQLDSRVIEHISHRYIPAIVTALLDNGDLFPIGEGGLLSLDTPMRVHRIIHRLLQRYKTTEERFMILQNAISKSTKSIYILVHELTEQGHEHHEASDTFLPLEYRDLTTEQLESLQRLVINRIENWAKSGRLEEHPHLLPILTAWRAWEHHPDCEKYVEQMTNTDHGLVTFLMASLEPAINLAITKYEKTPDWEKYLKNIDAFIPTKALEKHAKLLFEDAHFEKLREREQLALMIFLDLMKTDTTKVIPKTTA